MSGNLTSVSTEDQEQDGQGALPDSAGLSNALDHCPMQRENEVEEENKQEDGSGNEEEDEDEDADFNPFLKDTNSAEASSSLSSEVEDLDTDVAESSRRPPVVLDKSSEEIGRDGTKDCRTSGNIEHGEEIVMQTTVSSGEVCRTKEKEPLPQTQSENVYPGDKDNDLTTLTDVSNTTESRKPMADMDTEGAICMRTRARYSLASFSLDELETFLQETDDEDDLQNVDDEEEYRKFLAAVLRGDDSQNLEESTNVDDEDEENDADFELELEEALESEPEELEERRVTRRNRRQKASIEHNKKLSGHSNRPLRPLVPFASVGSFSTFDGKNLTPNIAPSYMPPANSGFTPDQIGQLHCLIHEHVQLLIQVFSLCVLEPAKSHIAAEVKELVLDMLQKRDQVLSWRTVPYPSFCFFPPYVHPSVSAELQKTLPPNGSDKNIQQITRSGGNRELHSDIISLSNERHKNLPDGQAGSSQTLDCTSWVPYICGPVLSITDVAPLRLVENYIEDVSSAVRAYERYQIEVGFETHCQKEPLFDPHNSSCSADSDGQGEAENPLPDSSMMLSSSSSNQMPKKTMAATLLEKAKSQSVALVPKEIAKLAQRFWPLFNPALYPRKPPPAPLANRVLFTDAEDELLALGLMEYNTDWKAIQQRFLPCKSRHQIFVRQKNRASSKAPENPIKAVRRMKNSPLTPEEIARIEVGLKRFKLDWISIWRCFVPYRDPSLLPRQWRIASGTQKSYKSDATKKEKRRLYQLRRKNSRPPPSTWHSSEEGDSTDNAVEETNSGGNRMDKEDEAYVHEAFLADWRPDNATTANLPTLLPTQEASQAREQNDNSGYGIFQPQMSSKSPASLRPPSSEVVLRPYRARKPNSARLVKLAPDLPPVNLPPSVRIMSQSAFKSSTVIASSINPGNASRTPGIAIDNRSMHSRSTIKSGVGSSVNSGPNGNNSVKVTGSSQHPNLSAVTMDKSVAERGDSDLQMHPLLFQTPQDGRSPYYPVSCNTSNPSSFTFFSGKQPQLSLGLFHNPRHIRDAVNFLNKSSKPPEINAPPSSSSSYGVDFHPLLQRTDDLDVDPTYAHPSARRPNAESKTQKAASASGRSNELDLDIHLSFTSKNQENRDMALLQGADRLLSVPTSGAMEPERSKDSSKKRDSATDRISRKVSGNEHDESLPEIIMEQEELSDSEEEFGENVEFECEEMADSEGDSTSDSEQFVNIPDEEVQDDVDADVDNGRVLTTTSSYGDNTANRPLNLNSCPPVSPHPPNIKNTVADYEFGPFGTTGTISPNNIPSSSKKSSSRHASIPRNPRKRVCRSNSNSGVGGAGKGNSSPNTDISIEKSNNVGTDEFC